MKTLVFLLRVVVFLACGRASAQILPPNTESEYFRTVGSGVLFDKNFTPTRAQVHMSVNIQKPLPDGSILVFLYENPADRSGALAEGTYQKAEKERILTMSPPFECMDYGSYYKVVARLYASSDRRQLLSTHQQMVGYFLPPIMQETMKIQSCGQPDPLAVGDTNTAALDYLRSIINHAPNLKAQRDLRAAFDRDPPLGFYYWGVYICEQMRRGVPEAQVRQKLLSERLREDLSYAMLRAARDTLCPDPKN